MSHAAAGEADEARMQVGKRLSQVGAQAVLMPLERILREKGNHIEVQCPHCLRLERENGGTYIGVCSQYSLLFLPLFGRYIDGGTGNLTAVLVEQANRYLASLAARCHAGKEREIVLLPFLQADAVETTVLQRHSGTGVQYGIMGIVGMDGVGSGDGICTVPTLTRTVSGRILEVAVLHQLGIQPTVCSIVDVFKEDAYQVVADGLGRLRMHFDGCLHRLQSGKADGVLLGAFGIECPAVLLVFGKGDDALHRGVRHALHPALPACAIQQDFLRHGGIYLHRLIFGKAGTVEVFLRLPLQ